MDPKTGKRQRKPPRKVFKRHLHPKKRRSRAILESETIKLNRKL